MTGYTVIDCETTGFVPEKNDRIVEIGVVYVSHKGEITGHWSTLVNPQRDVGPTHIHGITPTDLATAPTFAEIAPYALEAVSGRTIVAHNATFDLRFLTHEFLRAGVPLGNLPLRGLCTMRWSQAFLDSPSRKLADCCRACGVELHDAHSALSDALAAAGLLSYYLQQSQWQPPWHSVIAESRAYSWPTFQGPYPPSRFAPRAEVRAARREDAWLDRIVSRMPRAEDVRVDAYLAVLEMALFDGFLAEHEKDQLVDVAAGSGLSRGQVLDLHTRYLRAMAAMTLADGVVSHAERSDLEKVAAYLGLSGLDVDSALAAASGPVIPRPDLTIFDIKLRCGDRVVFTGEMDRSRTDWEDLCRKAGLEIGSLTKSTRVLVAADPNSQSGKAKKARSYGIPIITEEAFERLLLRLQEASR